MHNKPLGRAFLAPIIILTFTLTSVLGLLWWTMQSGAVDPTADAVLFTVVREDFEASITEPGDMESAKNVEIRCNVQSRGSAGTRILWVIPEGTKVEKDELLVQLDDSALQQELIQHEIQVSQDRASVIQATSDLETAKRVLFEYENGTFDQELAVIESELILARENQRRAIERAEYSVKLNVRGFNTRAELEADQFAVEKARNDVKLAEQKLKVFSQFTRERMLAEYQAEIEKQGANLQAARDTLRLSEKQRDSVNEQIVNCRIQAPSPGMLIYHTESDRRESGAVIEEGVEVRDGQMIARLPDPTQMRVITLINDSKISLVQRGQPAWIELDTDPNIKLQGEVEYVANFPLPRRWFQAPIDYEVYVRVTTSDPALRPDCEPRFVSLPTPRPTCCRRR